jgi:hypothetical protein
MIVISNVKRLEAAKKKSKDEFVKEFIKMFSIYAAKNLSFFELDDILNLIMDNDWEEIRNTVEEWREDAENKTLLSIVAGTPDTVYEDRFRKMKELDDLITYFIEEWN